MSSQTERFNQHTKIAKQLHDVNEGMFDCQRQAQETGQIDEERMFKLAQANTTCVMGLKLIGTLHTSPTEKILNEVR